jgi:NAD(P)H-hydrate epimerase
MRDFDAHVIGACKVPGIVLMENAGRGAADAIEERALRGKARGGRVVVVCGGGNNGGDGFVVARHLRGRGADVEVFAAVEPARLHGDARANHDAYVGVGGSVMTLVAAAKPTFAAAIARADVVVDALFGTGLDRPLVGEMVALVAMMNAAAATKVAIDVPSGIDADTGGTLGASFRADLTVTFAHPKIGLLTPQGAIAAGTVRVADIGVPGLLGPALTPAAEILEPADVARLLPARPLDDQKYKAGSVAVFAGAGGKVGAALMVARAALRAGAGLATIASWEESAPIVRGRVTEEMVAVLARGAGLGASLEAALDRKKAIVVGPGFGTDGDARAAVNALLDRWKGPAIYDADALTLHAAAPEGFARSAVPCVLTPHVGEAARLLGTTSEVVDGDRFTAARTLATRARAVVVLKGAYTLIAEPGGRVVVNPSSCPALATAGSGDTLAGIVGALLCQLSPFDAACAGVFIHAAAGEAWSAAHGDRGLLASEIGDGVPDVVRALSREHTRGPG